MKMPTLQEVKDKLSSVSLPKKLGEDLSSLGNVALFIASPPVYYGKKAFTEKINQDDWYSKSRRAIISLALPAALCFIGSCIFDENVVEDNISRKNKQEVTYDFGKVTYEQYHNHEVKNNSHLLKMFLPFERPFLPGTYGTKDQWTSFRGKMKKDGLEFTIEGNLPSTTNFTAITKEDLYRYTRNTHVEDTSRAAKYALDIK